LGNKIRNEPKPLPSKSALERLYVKERKSVQPIAKIYNVGPYKIRKLLAGYGIKVLPRGKWALGLTKETDNRIRRVAESKRGVTRSPETIQKIRESGTLFKKGQTPWIKGKHHTKKVRLLMSRTQFKTGQIPHNKGKKGPICPWKGETKETNPSLMKTSITLTGKKRPAKVIKKMSEAMTKKYQEHPELIEKLSKATIKHYQEHPETKEKLSKATIKYYREHPEAKVVLREYRAKQKFPSKDLKPELLTQSILKKHKISFKKHHTFKLSDSYHQADIVIEPNHVIEVFGDYWHFNPKIYDGESIQKRRRKEVKVKEVWEYDKYVIDGMKKQGYKVLVIWELELKNELEKTTNKILKFINN